MFPRKQTRATLHALHQRLFHYVLLPDFDERIDFSSVQGYYFDVVDLPIFIRQNPLESSSVVQLLVDLRFP